MKKWVSTVAACMAAVMLAGCGSSSDTTVAVDSVGNITGLGNVGATDKFSGIVVSEDEVEVEKNSGLSVKEVKVKEGDVVKEGQVLFEYDTDALELTLEKQKLELEQLQTTIESKTKENKQLQKDAKGTKGSTKLEYSIQIQTNEADIKEAEYNSKLKEKEIEETEKSLNNVNVTSPIDGTVKSISSDNSDSDSSGNYDNDGSGSSDGNTSNAFIVLTKSDSFEIKGTINEMSAQALQEGMQLLIRSRTDSTQTWTGTLERIDWEKADTSGGSSYNFGGSDEMTTSSKYPFYVSLDSQDGLIMGQHVYIETNVDGSTEETEAQFSLPAYYIVDADTDSPYVWAEGSNGKLEKRDVELGGYDEEADQYPVISGLALSDYIAFPSEDCASGAKAEHYDQYSDGGDDGAQMPEDGREMYDEGAVGEGMDNYDGAMPEDGMDTYDETMPDEGAYDEAMPEGGDGGVSDAIAPESIDEAE